MFKSVEVSQVTRDFCLHRDFPRQICSFRFFFRDSSERLESLVGSSDWIRLRKAVRHCIFVWIWPKDILFQTLGALLVALSFLTNMKVGGP